MMAMSLDPSMMQYQVSKDIGKYGYKKKQCIVEFVVLLFECCHLSSQRGQLVGSL